MQHCKCDMLDWLWKMGNDIFSNICFNIMTLNSLLDVMYMTVMDEHDVLINTYFEMVLRRMWKCVSWHTPISNYNYEVKDGMKNGVDVEISMPVAEWDHLEDTITIRGGFMTAKK